MSEANEALPLGSIGPSIALWEQWQQFITNVAPYIVQSLASNGGESEDFTALEDYVEGILSPTGNLLNDIAPIVAAWNEKAGFGTGVLGDGLSLLSDWLSGNSAGDNATTEAYIVAIGLVGVAAGALAGGGAGECGGVAAAARRDAG